MHRILARPCSDRPARRGPDGETRNGASTARRRLHRGRRCCCIPAWRHHARAVPGQIAQERGQFPRYVRDGFYDGTVFHRVIHGYLSRAACIPNAQPKRTRPAMPAKRTTASPTCAARWQWHAAPIPTRAPRNSSSTWSTTDASITPAPERIDLGLHRVRQGHQGHGRGRQDRRAAHTGNRTLRRRCTQAVGDHQGRRRGRRAVAG